MHYHRSGYAQVPTDENGLIRYRKRLEDLSSTEKKQADGRRSAVFRGCLCPLLRRNRMETPPLLQLTHITKSFRGIVALKDMDLQLNEGEVISLVGENGAGKSTLMSIIGGIYTPEKGEIFIKGESVRIENPGVARKHGIGYVHQEPTLAPNMTGTENLFLGQEKTYSWIMADRKSMHLRAKKILEEIGISFDPQQKVSEMTMAEKEAVAISKAMLQRPKILILDEVTAPLDQVGVSHLFKIIRKLKRSGIGIIYITHRLRETFEISDKIFVLRDGKKVGIRDPEETSQKEIIKMMVGEEGISNANGDDERISKEGRELLRCEGLSHAKSFRNINMRLRTNEIVGLAGLKGAGRSRFARALFGLLKVDGGAIHVDGQKVEIKNPLQAMNAGIGYIPGDRQHEGIALIRNVGENLSITTLGFFSYFLGVLKLEVITKRAEQMVRNLNVKPPSLKKAVANLSGGNQQKVMIGKWLERDLPILVFDEPTRGVDVKSKAEIHRLLGRLKNQGKGIIVISSDLPELISVSDRILVMNQGSITTECSYNESTEEHILQCLHVDPATH
jgi:ABC-type sugar transport system ATPase subunit